MSELVESATWSGRKGSLARTLSVSLIDDDGWKHARSGIDVTKGNHCVFYWEAQSCFCGIIMQQRQSTKKTMTIKAYDVWVSTCRTTKTATAEKGVRNLQGLLYTDSRFRTRRGRHWLRHLGATKGPKRQPAMLFWTP